MQRFLVIVNSIINLAFSQSWKTFGDIEYYFARNTSTFSGAMTACNSLKADLVAIRNETIQKFL